MHWIIPAGAAGALGVLCLLILSLESNGAASNFSFLAALIVDLAAGGLMLYAGLTLHRLRSRLDRVWGLAGVGLLLICTGNMIFQGLALATGKQVYDSPANILYLLGYLSLLTAGLLIPSKRLGKLAWGKAAIDILIVMLAALLVYWNVLLSPLITASAGKTSLEVFLLMAYPIADLVMLWAALVALYRLSSYPGRSPIWLLLAGVVVNIALDTTLSYLALQPTFKVGSWIDFAHVFQSGLLVWGALLQERQARSKHWTPPDRAPENADHGAAPAPFEGTFSWLIYMPYLWVGGAYLLLIWLASHHTQVDPVEVTLMVGGIVLLVILRQVVTFQENSQLYRDLQASHMHTQRQALALELANREMLAEIQERRRMEYRLSHDALHDSLTGLPNRTLALDHIGQAMRKKKRSKTYHYALLFLDLDRFKVINDSLGHTTGDTLLKHVAQTLVRALRGTDTVARMGGDEFVVLLEDLAAPEDAALTAERLQIELARPLTLGRATLYVSVSIGIVNGAADYELPDGLLRDADLAMYQAKARGKGGYTIFDSGMRTTAVSRLEIENDIHHAFECGEFMLYYQPVIALADNRVVGFEALARWQHPTRGLLGSSVFIPIAEETGLILALGRWVLFEACAQAAKWNRNGAQACTTRISVNVSGKQLHQPDFTQLVKQALAASGLPGHCLVLEVTESVCVDNIDRVRAMLVELGEAGVEVQIDDFGTGYSSLSYLMRLPVHTIKIDKTFIQPVANIDGDGEEGGMDMLHGILSMVDEIGIQAVAEGIENPRQLEALRRLGCAYGQGFFLAPPMDAVDTGRWLVERNA